MTTTVKQKIFNLFSIRKAERFGEIIEINFDKLLSKRQHHIDNNLSNDTDYSNIKNIINERYSSII